MRMNAKEAITNRMMKKAARLWNIPVNEINETIDPLVSLLFSACASELEKISVAINDTQINTTERLIQLMAPLSSCEVKPAHAIAYCESTLPKTIITPNDQFFYKDKQADSNSNHHQNDVFFTPTQETTLLDACVKYMFTGNKLFTISGHKSKELTHIIDHRSDTDRTTLYLGIESSNAALDLENVSFYFEYLGVDESDQFYHHLKHATWRIGKQKINAVSGYVNSEGLDAMDLDAIINGQANRATAVCEEINQYYKKHFVTLKGANRIEENPSYEAFKSLNSHDAEYFDFPNTLWIEVEFSSIVNSKTLEQLFCGINAFPVVNRKMHQFSYQMKNIIDIIPVISESPFFDIKSIENTSGQTYKNQGTQVSEADKGGYILKNAHVGKLDSRNAKEYLSHLIGLIKDESAAFQFYNHEFLQNDLNVLNQTVAVIEKKLEEVIKEGTHAHYIYLNPYESNETIQVTYWTTNGAEANHIKARKALEVYKGKHLNTKSSYLITPVFGGRHQLNSEQRLQAYRRAALTQNKIVTEEDIKAVCYELYTNHIASVEIEKGISTDLSVNKGMTPCIEITLSASENSNLKPYEWDYLNHRLKTILEKQSTNVFPFQIINKS